MSGAPCHSIYAGLTRPASNGFCRPCKIRYNQVSSYKAKKIPGPAALGCDGHKSLVNRHSEISACIIKGSKQLKDDMSSKSICGSRSAGLATDRVMAFVYYLQAKY